MSAWIELDGVRSDAFQGVMVTNVTPFIKARKRATRTALAGRLGQIEEGEATLETAEIAFDLNVHGDNRVSAVERARQLSPWLNGTMLRTYLEPDAYCTGAVETEVTGTKASGRSLTLSCRFTANPGCMFYPPAGFTPSAALPIPEQITAQNASASGTFATGGRLPVMQDGSTYGPSLYLKITGTWQQLAIGTLVVVDAFEASDTLYIDCENQVAYRFDGTQRANVAVSGSYPANDPQGIAVGGNGINVTVQALKIGRW